MADATRRPIGLSWNEIRNRAAEFARENAGATYEKGETQGFYDEFFAVFGVTRKRVAVFEQQVRKLDNSLGFIDLFWPGTLVVEHKSAGRSLQSAKLQAYEYTAALKENEQPRYILVSDFQNFHLFDLEERKDWEFKLRELSEKVELFGFIMGREPRVYADQPSANIEAAELMGTLHDGLKAAKYRGHDLEQFLVRLLFCLFADDTGIFEPRGIFEAWLTDCTAVDGRGLGGQLTELFQVLDTPVDERADDIDEDLARFPYINGDLFKEVLRIPPFTKRLRDELLAASAFKWQAVSPAIFGSLFQSVMKSNDRRQLGAHYTSEKNILKVIHPLFLDGLQAEFHRASGLKRGRTAALEALQQSLGRMRVFDPACGCGNFLILAYRELRELELLILQELKTDGQLNLDARSISVIDVDQFYGIEVEEFPARIAEVAMWMMDHIMNSRLGAAFGPVFTRIPLNKSPHIKAGNALQTDWGEVLDPAQCTVILGNPPFVGHQYRTPAQQTDMHRVWGRNGQVNRLDYVTCWFKLAVDYARNNEKIRIGFVSTNSICQGEQASILWAPLFKEGVSIEFAHRSFQWNSEARGSAAVHCIITGLVFGEPAARTIYDYATARSDPQASPVGRINGYLVDGPHYALPRRGKPQPGMLPMHKGSQPTDGARIKNPDGEGYLTFSNLILNEAERRAFLEDEPAGENWLRRYVGGEELLSGIWRWCLWLKDVPPAEIRHSKPLAVRLARVKENRLKSATRSVQAMAKSPTLFTQDRQPSVPYLCIPEVSSEHREYVPWAELTPDIIASNKLQIIPSAPLDYFGILSSSMHMAWMRTVAGRLESRYSYSPAVYYSFPWPELNAAKINNIRSLAADVLDARANAPGSLADNYDPDVMPSALREAHRKLDRAVDRLYRGKAFSSERERVQHLFDLYETRVVPLAKQANVKKPAARRVGCA